VENGIQGISGGVGLEAGAATPRTLGSDEPDTIVIYTDDQRSVEP
jgi:hypothetical protein